MQLYDHERKGLKIYTKMIAANLVNDKFQDHGIIVTTLGLERVQKLISCYEPSMTVGDLIHEFYIGIPGKKFTHFKGIRGVVSRVLKINAQPRRRKNTSRNPKRNKDPNRAIQQSPPAHKGVLHTG